MKWIIGLAAGAAVVYFLKTEKGKALVETLQKDAGSIGEKLFSIAGDLLKKGTSFAGEAADRTKISI